MARPSNSIANIKLPGENTQRPIVPYAVGVNSNNSYQAVLPTLTADDTIVIGSIVADEYVASTTLTHTYAKGDYCKHDGFLYRAKESTMGTWDATKWEKVDIGSQLNLLQYGVYTPSNYGYNKEGVSAIVGPTLHINQAEDHEDYMFDFSSREGTAPDWSFYSTKIYPGKITLNGDEVVTQSGLTNFVVGPASSTNNNIALFDGTTGKLIKSDDKINYSYTESSSQTQAETSLNLSRTYTVSGGRQITEIVHYHTDGIESEFRRNGEVVTRYAYLFPSQGGTIALTSDLNAYVTKSTAQDIDADKTWVNNHKVIFEGDGGNAEIYAPADSPDSALNIIAYYLSLGGNGVRVTGGSLTAPSLIAESNIILKASENSSTHVVTLPPITYQGYGSAYSSKTNLNATYTANVSDVFNINLPAKSGTLSLEIDIVDLTL